MARDITEGTIYTNVVVMPEDGIDARTAASLYPATESLTSRANWLKAELAARTTELATANGKITALETQLNALSALVTGSYHKYDNPGVDWVLPANTNIRVLEVNVGYGATGSTQIQTTIDMSASQPEGKIITVMGSEAAPSNSNSVIGEAILDGGIKILGGAYTAVYLRPKDNKNRAITLIYLNGKWNPMSEYGRL